MPAIDPVINPLIGTTETIPDALDDHVPPATESLNNSELLMQMLEEPLMIEGKGLTFTTVVAGIPQPVEYEIIAVPPTAPVTIPEVLTVAVEGEALLHDPPDETSESVVAVNAQIGEVPPDIGKGDALLTVTEAVDVPQRVV